MNWSAGYARAVLDAMMTRLMLKAFQPRKPGPHFPSRYKYQCMSCGGPLSSENVLAGKDCYWCELDRAASRRDSNV